LRVEEDKSDKLGWEDGGSCCESETTCELVFRRDEWTLWDWSIYS